MSEYIRIEKSDMNECPIKYMWQIYLNIQIYSSHSDPEQWQKSGYLARIKNEPWIASTCLEYTT